MTVTRSINSTGSREDIREANKFSTSWSKQCICKIIPTLPRFHLTFVRSGPAANSSRSKFSQRALERTLHPTHSKINGRECRGTWSLDTWRRTRSACCLRALRHSYGISYRLRSGIPLWHHFFRPLPRWSRCTHARFSKLLPRIPRASTTLHTVSYTTCNAACIIHF